MLTLYILLCFALVPLGLGLMLFGIALQGQAEDLALQMWQYTRAPEWNPDYVSQRDRRSAASGLVFSRTGWPDEVRDQIRLMRCVSLFLAIDGLLFFAGIFVLKHIPHPN
ncbi:MAG: hypothetical protein JO171_01245 [Paludibacterium sp.]|uniref:hypothetical protein n=1 Tax=Paludibacterium sp. TaxID=1917523 RepID=UPI0025CE259F|nr:hypothetical protein [Paludibacterium sp.]MBV8045751.1 hypothetical protein [Paludibacterium sp.]